MLTAGLLSVLAGLGLSRTDLAVPAVMVWFVFVFLLASIRRANLMALTAAMVLGLTFGLWRGSSFMIGLEPYQDLKMERVVLEVRAVSDGVYSDKAQLEFDGGNVRVIEPYAAELPGRVRISGFGEQAVYRGDAVRAEGKLYPSRGSRQASVSYAELSVQARNQDLTDRLRLRFVAGMQTALPEPLASFGLGLLIGQRTTLPDSVNDQLAAVGLTHIIAVSGYNLTIIIRAVGRLGKKRSKYQTLLLSLGLIAGFLLVTGLSASIVRAAIVSTLGLAAWYYGRKFRPILLLTLAAVMTAGWNPLYLWSDIGWYLSFLAFYGVLVLVPLAVRRLYGPQKEPKPLTYLLLESVGAQVMTAPLILYIFGQASLVAIISNLLVVPLVPIAMLLTLGAGLSGMLAPLIAGWLAWPAKIILTYMLDIANLLSRVPHALVHRALPLLSMLCLYAFVILFSVVLWSKTTVKHGTITDIKD